MSFQTLSKNGTVVFVEFGLNGNKKRMRMIKEAKGWVLK